MNVRQHSNPDFFLERRFVDFHKAAAYLDRKRRFKNRRLAIRVTTLIAFTAFSIFVIVGVH